MDVSYFKNRPKDGSFNLEAYEAALEHKPNHGKIIKEGKDEWSDMDDDSDSDDSNNKGEKNMGDDSEDDDDDDDDDDSDTEMD